MSYLPQDDVASAQIRSEEIAAHLGSASVGSVTRYWYPVIERPEVEDSENPTTLPDGVDVALEVAEEDGSLQKLIREDELTDEEIAELVELYKLWQDDFDYVTGDLRAFDGQLYECIQPHTAIVTWEPVNVPALWTRKTPERVIPIWVQRYAPPYFKIGDVVTHNGQTWEATQGDVNGNNVWQPGVFGWTQQ